MQLLFLQQWFSDEVLKAIGWTLIHSLWQGLLAAVIAGIIIISTRRSAANLRYNLLGFVIVLFLITNVITFSRQLEKRDVSVPSFIELTVPATEAAAVTNNFETVSTPAGNTIDKFVVFFNTNANLFVLIWAVFCLFHCIKLATGLAGIQRIRSYKTHMSPDTWQIKLNQLSKALGLKRSVGLLQSELVKVPVAIGLFKPVILIPLGLLSHLPPEQVETILLHELAHVRRKDYLVNILQRFIEAVFFFNPALIWVSSLIRQEREACCDDIVVANTTHKGNYLEALVSFQEYSLAASGYAMAITSKRHYLLNRVKRMITRENKKLDIMEKIFLLAGLITITAFTFIPKKEIVSKKNFAAIEPIKEQVEQKVTPVASLVVPASKDKPVVKKENKKPVLEVKENAPLRDTLPAKQKEKTGNDDLKFPSISSSINDDGKTKTESVAVTDQDGKKYSYTKLNNKVTSLVIDGKNIPENEINNYSELLDKIEMAMQEHKARRLKDLELRKVDMARRTEDLKARTLERKTEREYQNILRQYAIEQNRQSRLAERTKKTSEGQRKEVQKLLNKLKERKENVPMINGREVIKNNTPDDNLVNTDLNFKLDFNTETAKLFQATQNIKFDAQNTTNCEAALYKTDQLKFEKSLNANINANTDLLANTKYNLTLKNENQKNFYYSPDNTIKKTENPVKAGLDTKPSTTVPPVTLKKNPPIFKKRVTT